MAQYSYKTKHGKRWRYDAPVPTAKDDKGRAKRVSGGGFMTKGEARLHERDALEEVKEHGFSNGGATLFRTVYERWFLTYKNSGIAESTWATTERNFRLHILTIFGDKPINSITPQDCQDAAQLWFDAGFQKYHDFIKKTSHVFRYAVRMQLVSADPASLVDPPRRRDRSKQKKDNYYNEQQLSDFLNAMQKTGNRQAYTLCVLLAATGMRKGEATALKWTDFNVQAKSITISKTVTRGAKNRLYVSPNPKTASSNRTIYLTDNQAKVLQQWRWAQAQEFFRDGVKYAGADQLMFTNEKNKLRQPCWINKRMDEVIAANKFKRITPHGFRHSWATISHDKGIDPLLIVAELGHKSITTTYDVYTAITSEQAQSIPGLFTAPRPTTAKVKED